MEIGIAITGDRRVALKFDEFPREAHDRLLAAINSLTLELEERVRAAEPARTGKLRRSTVGKVFDDKERISGRVSVGADFGKAAALEYGAHGTAKVRAHMARLDHVFARLVAPMTIAVAAHSRHVNIAEHRFLRGPLAQMSAEVVAQLRAAVAQATEEAP